MSDFSPLYKHSALAITIGDNSENGLNPEQSMCIENGLRLAQIMKHSKETGEVRGTGVAARAGSSKRGSSWLLEMMAVAAKLLPALGLLQLGIAGSAARPSCHRTRSPTPAALLKMSLCWHCYLEEFTAAPFGHWSAEQGLLALTRWQLQRQQRGMLRQGSHRDGSGDRHSWFVVAGGPEPGLPAINTPAMAAEAVWAQHGTRRQRWHQSGPSDKEMVPKKRLIRPSTHHVHMVSPEEFLVNGNPKGVTKVVPDSENIAHFLTPAHGIMVISAPVTQTFQLWVYFAL
eukprot:g43828.t1